MPAGVLIAMMVVLAACSSDDDGSNPPNPTTTAGTTTASTSTSLPASTSTAPPSTTTTITSPGSVPPTVTVLSAGPGGGSGEIELTWDAVAGATGYRIDRATSSGGPFTVSADVDVSGGTATVASGVTNVYSELRSYFPSSATTSAPSGDDTPSRFHYIEVTSARTYLRVTAHSASGEASASTVVCAAPSGVNTC